MHNPQKAIIACSVLFSDSAGPIDLRRTRLFLVLRVDKRAEQAAIIPRKTAKDTTSTTGCYSGGGSHLSAGLNTMLLQLVASWQGVAVTCLAAVLTVVLFVWRMLQRIRSRDLALLGFHDEYHSEHVERDRRFTCVSTGPSRVNTDQVYSIIAIHGLGSNPATTWSAKSGGTRIHWLKDPEFLPSKFPDATILTYNHNADWIYRASPTTARDCAQQLLQDILRWRAKHVSVTLHNLPFPSRPD